MITLFYILFFGITNFTAHCLINNRKYLNRKHVFTLLIFFIIFMILQVTLEDALLPLNNKNLFIIIELLLSAMFLNFLGILSIKQTTNSQKLTEYVKDMSIKIKKIIFTKAIYIVVFLAQVLIVISNP